jgi:PAS domain-containing protein
MTASVQGGNGVGGTAHRAAGLEAPGPAAAAALFAGPGEVRALARALDWGATPLGWPDTWSPALRITTRAMLDAPHPVCLWSGPELALVYNDAYRRILAAKHPASLGQPGSVVWAEIWEGLAPQFAQVSAGGPPVYGEDARFVMARLEGGRTEDAWFSYSLSALRDEDGTVVAVLNISPETTGRVRAEQALEAERERLRGVILQAPVPMALHDGPEHRYVLVNDAYRRVSGGRDVTGLTLREAFPEVAGQGLYEVFDRVYATGESWSGPETHLRYDRRGLGIEDAWFDLRYDPVRDADGRSRASSTSRSTSPTRCAPGARSSGCSRPSAPPAPRPRRRRPAPRSCRTSRPRSRRRSRASRWPRWSSNGSVPPSAPTSACSPS